MRRCANSQLESVTCLEYAFLVHVLQVLASIVMLRMYHDVCILVSKTQMVLYESRIFFLYYSGSYALNLFLLQHVLPSFAVHPSFVNVNTETQ